MNNVKSLLKNWALPDRSADRTQLTLRLPFTDYARLQALKEVYPSRSLNEFVCDLLETGLDEVVESLPSWEVSEHEAEFPEEVGAIAGPRVVFDVAYARILKSESEGKSA